MMKFDKLVFAPRAGIGGLQATVFFPNGYGASIVQGFGTYGESDGLWELAVLVGVDGESTLTYSTPITNDVLGHLDEIDVTQALLKIEALPQAAEDALQIEVDARAEIQRRAMESFNARKGAS